MKYKTLIRVKSFHLLTLLVAVWLTGCMQEEFDATPPIAGNGVQFTLTVPDAGIPSVSSRAMVGTGVANKEDEVKTVDIDRKSVV